MVNDKFKTDQKFNEIKMKVTLRKRAEKKYDHIEILDANQESKCLKDLKSYGVKVGVERKNPEEEMELKLKKEADIKLSRLQSM